MLPAWCRHTQEFRERVPGGNSPDEIRRWRGVFGDTYEHLHHYCWGMMKANRARLLARDQQSRRAYEADAIDEYNYVLRHATEDYFLLPEVITRKGESLLRLEQGPVAVTEFERAIALKPDYWPPYAHLSDYYRALGQRPKAIEVLERGLAAVPDAAPLTRRLKELDPRSGAK